MRIIVATSFVPFRNGGASLLFDWLCTSLERVGHSVERLALPFDPRPQDYLEQLVGWRSIDLNGRADALIAVRTPSYVLRHDRKVCWFIHHHRSAYDLWGSRWSSIPDDADGRRLRDAIRASDDVTLRECAALFANSPIVARRLRRYNGLNAEVLLPPVLDPDRFRAASYGEAVFYPSRLTGHKRQDLAIDAMRYTRSGVRLVVAGEPDDAAYGQQLRRLVDASPARARIDLRLGWLEEGVKEQLLSDALAVVYVPYDEDSYGFPILEGALAGKCAVTVTDAGGAAEFVRDGETGIVTDPDPVALAAAFDELYVDRARAAALGETARALVGREGIAWGPVVERLLSALALASVRP